jgi:hypothetical protein
VSVCMARSTICTFAALTTPSRCNAAKPGSRGASRFPVHGGAGPERRGGADSGSSFTVGELQDPYQELGDGGRAVFPRQISSIGSSDQPGSTRGSLLRRRSKRCHTATC